MLAQPGDRLEVAVGRFVIDVVRADGELIEVQTGGFGPLSTKLDECLTSTGCGSCTPSQRGGGSRR